MKKLASKTASELVNLEWYRTTRKARKDYLKKKYHNNKRKKLPWYFLTKGKSFDQSSYKIKSETKQLNDRYVIDKMSRSEYIERLIKYKTDKWKKKHPCPVNGNDLFEEEFRTKWNKEYQDEILRIRDFVTSIYDTYVLYGRYEIRKGKYNRWGTITIAKLKGTKNILLRARTITNEEKRRNPRFVCANLRNTVTNKGKILLPMAAA